jgi:DNA-binding transcriptional LysR family regulator
LELGGTHTQDGYRVGASEEGVRGRAAAIDGDCGNGLALGLGDQHEAGERLDRIELGEQLDGLLGRAGLPDSEGGGGHVDQFDVSEAEVPLNLLSGTRKVYLRVLDVRKLRVLREVETRGTIAAAAAALRYTPSAVSQQLATLQAEAGVALVERVGRSVRLTDAGRRLVRHADEILSRLEEAEAELAGGDAVRGTVRVSAFQTAALALLPRAIAELGARHPDLRVEYTEAEAEESLPLLAGGGLDLVIAEEYDHLPRPRDPRLRREELGRDPILVALPEGHRMARLGRPVPLVKLAAEPWATGRSDTLFADMVLRACRGAGFEPDLQHRANDLKILFELVAAGHAVALAPGLANPPAIAGVTALPTAGRPLGRTIFTAVRRSSARQPAVEALLGALQACAARLDQRLLAT